MSFSHFVTLESIQQMFNLFNASLVNTAALSPVKHDSYTERFVPEPGKAGTRKSSSQSDWRKVLPGRREEAAEYLGEG